MLVFEKDVLKLIVGLFLCKVGIWKKNRHFMMSQKTSWICMAFNDLAVCLGDLNG